MFKKEPNRKYKNLEFLDVYQLIITLCLFFACANISIAQTSFTQFQEANNFYQSKQYSKAIEVYEGILTQGEYSAELYYNAGNAYFRNGNLGKAIVNFERALLEDPGNEDIQYNLKIANENRIDEIDILQPFFLKQWWISLREMGSEGFWSGLGLLFLWLGVGGIVLWLIGQERTQKKKGFFVGIILLILSILPFSLASSRSKFEDNSEKAILISESIYLKSGPDDASTDILKIHEGLKVNLLDKIGEWHKVKLSNGEEGWLPEGVLEEI
ncbi:MAG: tetratricopeptide repeat protein [Bacteroidetes bacterium]|jgi:tetratricopeptide (TPR) repeat protein|nr:tetratricopeptide repeat protein [Bacteroidota bacterium]MDF1865858.1 tetratricopeptide repeat protein [Saprospiraceae bacterium]